jgi:hypothetical protein
MLGGCLLGACKKADDVGIQALLTSGKWRLASWRVEILHNDTSKSNNLLYTTCRFNQDFTFNSDGTCSYENFACSEQQSRSTWNLNSDNISAVYLRSNLQAKDDSVSATVTPFVDAQVVNLGQNSLVLQTVAADTLRRLPNIVVRRVVTRYGFVRLNL